MENLIEIKSNYNSLDKLYLFLDKESNYECSKDYDIWEQRTDANGQMEQCIIIKKSGMHAVKAFFVNNDTVKINYIIPNKMMHAYFGKSVKARRNIIEIIAGIIKQALLKGPQEKAFKELESVIHKAAA
ncbi:hypothetical protein H2O64_03350 [Kordia sp. YSTF-M3]|uniref:Uncharacterized protein n=1 Tax=Kordia aestuariivivens TaxID=2759037 RepID=A0ABR7Q543_9FLAO|nr:hypothetical protein [Kordia aestuariivivens]MBC8753689.1 hypothetical protein [Kordia aestuariivivens]